MENLECVEINLNTSHVKVNLFLLLNGKMQLLYLNTSHVKVNPIAKPPIAFATVI